MQDREIPPLDAMPCTAAPPIISIWPWLILLFPLSLLEGRSRRVEYVNTRRRTSTPEADVDDVLDEAPFEEMGE